MAVTIKTGTTLIEEGRLTPESLRFETEPWTFFYMAGGIIRELQKMSGKQSKYASEGNMVHSDKVIDEEAEFKTFGCGSAIASSSRTTEWVKGKSSRKRWPSRTRISCSSSVFPRAALLDAAGYSGIGGGYIWWVALFCNGSSSENPALRVVR